MIPHRMPEAPIYDLRGLNCPLPVLKARRRLADMETGERVWVETTDPLAFRYYDPERVVLGKKMADHLRMAVCYWHTFCWPGADMV